MKTMLVIPDYTYIENWESARPYFDGFSQIAEANGWKVTHINQGFSLEEIDCIFVSNYMPYLSQKFNKDISLILKSGKKRIVSIFESPTRRPDLWEQTKDFDLCISFNKKSSKTCLCDHIEVPYPNNFSTPRAERIPWNLRGNLVWVASNNWFRGKDSLSQKRLRDFHLISKQLGGENQLYGMGWDKENVLLKGPGKFMGYINSVKNQKVYQKVKDLWKGPAEDKLLTISRFKFYLAYENTDNYPGYVTEKVFDAWNSGCIPIYYGDKAFEEKYRELLFSPRVAGLSNMIDQIKQISADEADNISMKFFTLLQKGEFQKYSHKYYLDKLFRAATMLC